MSSKFDISDARLIVGETAAPVMYANFGADGNAEPTYRCLASDPRTEEEKAAGPDGTPAVPDPRTILMQAFELNDDERAVLPTLMKCAHAILPLQGFGLISEGHHYLSDRARASFKAFHAVERQHWVGDRVSAYLKDAHVDVRDILWHKAGHPVAIAVKQFAATSEQVAKNLRQADLGSAAVRLPTVEPEVRAISAFLRVTDAVKPSIETYHGKVDNKIFREVQEAMSHFPMATLADIPNYTAPEPIVLGAVTNADGSKTGGTRVTNRKEVLTFAKALITRCQNSVAVCFGYYVAMLEATNTMGGGGTSSRDTLVRAFSLKKLQTECLAAYIEGMEFYKDVQEGGEDSIPQDLTELGPPRVDCPETGHGVSYWGLVNSGGRI
ncbi:hypothetical protein V6N13_070889 [Hibiscus sabdariffa]